MFDKFVKPGKAGLVVVHPATGATLPEKGDWWPHDQFLMRRLRDGDVVEAKPEPEPEPAPEADPPQARPALAAKTKE